MRTLVVSDLHLGADTGVDVLRGDVALQPLLDELETIDRLVLLGDTLELRHGPAAIALTAARPVLERIGQTLPRHAEIVVLPGNHDHSLVSTHLAERTEPLELETAVPLDRVSPVGQQLAGALGLDRTRFAYPGIWLREDVYATHGHFGDVHTTLPMFERLAAGVMAHLGAAVPDHDAVPHHYERALAPLYAWVDATAQRAPSDAELATDGGGMHLYRVLTTRGRRPLSHRALGVGFPLAIRALVPWIGPLSADLSVAAVRRSALTAMGEVIRRLQIDAEHVIFGHTHRAGPLPGDHDHEWRTDTGVRMHNTGNWVLERHFMPTPHVANPYWPGSAILLEDSAPPELKRLLGDFVSYA
ncbi:MAG TPA: metallophosphoesterase [Baekduia sp.]|nr:metallophosphoesterase [Baekduia sp.]